MIAVEFCFNMGVNIMNANKSHQKARGIAFLILAVFLIAFGVMAFAGMQQEQAKYEAEGTRDFNLLSADELAGKPYVEGRIDKLEELETERIPYFAEGKPAIENHWQRAVSGADFTDTI